MAHQKISDEDYSRLSQANVIARATAIASGRPWQMPGMAGTPLGARTAVTTDAAAAARKAAEKRSAGH